MSCALSCSERRAGAGTSLTALLILALLSPAALFAQAPPPVRRTARAGVLPDDAAPPTIDGKVTEAVWQTVTPFAQFIQQDPAQGEPATEDTEVRVLFSKTHVYVSFVCLDRDPSKIIVSQAKRDSSLTDTDSVIMVLDTFNDSQNAFVFGTNPIGIEYDGQVAQEGQTSGIAAPGQGGGGVQRGNISAFNPNWDGDWTVKASVTERGWEAEMAIPLKTLRYATGDDRTWGINVLRNIRHKNEQTFLSAIPRGFDIYRVSMAAKLTGLRLASRRDVKVIPYVLGSSNKDFTRATRQVDTTADVGGELKWGVRPSLTLDLTVNTDFAQVEADDEQVNLTRFDQFFPEKRPFFLENASTFQFGAPQAIDMFFTRRIGLSSSGAPIDILGGGRLSGKLGGGWNVGLLDIQTHDKADFTGRVVAPDTNFSVVRLQKEVGRSNYGAVFIGKHVSGLTDTTRAQFAGWNRSYGLDANIQLSRNQRFAAFVARTDSPVDAPDRRVRGSGYASRAFYNFTNNLWQVSGGMSQVDANFNPEVGFLPRAGFWRPEFRVFYQPQPKNLPPRLKFIRRFAPHYSYNAYYSWCGHSNDPTCRDNQLQTSSMHIHTLEVQPQQGGRFGWFTDRNQDVPLAPFVVFNKDGKRVAIAPGKYTWWQNAFEYNHNPSAPVTATFRVRVGKYYDGDFNAIEFTSDYRLNARTTTSVGWTRQDISLPAGAFVTNLVPVKASYAFTPLASLSVLAQYNGQSGLYSANVRLALLNRSGTGLFVVYNDRRDNLQTTSYDTVGRSFIVKYTRLFDF
ncbi:MAG: DUF5916 domain-containing protein [Vicinamibacterales bacterium]